MYKLTESPYLVIRVADNAYISLPPKTPEAAEYMDWLAAGNTPLPIDAVTADEVRQGCVDYFCDKMDAGFSYLGVTYQINSAAQADIGNRAIYATLSKGDPVTFPWGDPYYRGWWDVLNVYHAMTADEFLLFAKAVSDYVSTCAACCRDHKNAITPENCTTYDYTLNWPLLA